VSLELINFAYDSIANSVQENGLYDGIKALLGVSFGQFLGYVKNDDKDKFQERLDELLESNEEFKNKLMDLKSGIVYNSIHHGIGDIFSANTIYINPKTNLLNSNANSQDVDFWIELFNNMPFPTFVKMLQGGNKEQHEHILVNSAMKNFETSFFENKRFQGNIDERLDDYIFGDEKTYAKGIFKQLEVCSNMEDGSKPSIILTLKQLFKYNNISYILGTYIPVDPIDIMDNKEDYKIKIHRNQLVLSIQESKSENSSININIGNAIKRNFENVLNKKI